MTWQFTLQNEGFYRDVFLTIETFHTPTTEALGWCQFCPKGFSPGGQIVCTKWGQIFFTSLPPYSHTGPYNVPQEPKALMDVGTSSGLTVRPSYPRWTQIPLGVCPLQPEWPYFLQKEKRFMVWWCLDRLSAWLYPPKIADHSRSVTSQAEVTFSTPNRRFFVDV